MIILSQNRFLRLSGCSIQSTLKCSYSIRLHYDDHMKGIKQDQIVFCSIVILQLQYAIVLIQAVILLIWVVALLILNGFDMICFD